MVYTSVIPFFTLCILSLQVVAAQTGEQWITFKPEDGPGNGRHIVLVSGDDEYRSEETLPMLAKILSRHHGFKTTVLFAIDPESGEITPDHQTNIPGLEHLRDADLMILCIRFRELPNRQMRYFDEYVQSGKPVIGIRTSTHAFRFERNPDNHYRKYDFRSEVPGWEGGFGQQILGETWTGHHGDHGTEATRALRNGIMVRKDHPVIRGVSDIWVPTNVYGVLNLERDSDVLLWGQSTRGKKQDAPLIWEKPVMPIAWTRYYTSENGNTGRVFTTTMGSSVDFLSEDLRRLLVNASYWALQMEDAIPEKSNAEIVGEYNPTMYGFDDYIRGLRPADYK